MSVRLIFQLVNRTAWSGPMAQSLIFVALFNARDLSSCSLRDSLPEDFVSLLLCLSWDYLAALQTCARLFGYWSFSQDLANFAWSLLPQRSDALCCKSLDHCLNLSESRDWKPDFLLQLVKMNLGTFSRMTWSLMFANPLKKKSDRYLLLSKPLSATAALLLS